jgi:hypothetical protein
VRHLLVIALVACGHPDVKHATPPGGATTHTTTAGSGSARGSAAPTPVAVADIGCLTPSCAFHPGAAAYFTCLAGGAGACFHFGGPCTPADSCMYDPAAKTYKSCARPVEGQCQQWGAACAPANGCMFDPQDGLHHHCDQVTGGTCARYGALCAP